MMNLKTGDIVCDGVRLNYYRTGGDLPALVMIHGFTDDGLCWTPVARQLADRYDVVMVDLRGHGKSEAPETGYDLGTLARDNVGLIRALGLEKPILLGHSLGAVTALTIAGMFPELPKAILLEDPPAFWQMDERPGSRPNSFHAFIEGVKRKTRDELLAGERANNPAWSEEEIGLWADSKQRFSYKIENMVASPEVIPADFAAMLKRITCPMLLITGDPARGVAIRDEHVETLRQLTPQVERAPIAGASHCIHRDQMAAYMEMLQAYLAKIG